jgi:hypothetical protein
MLKSRMIVAVCTTVLLSAGLLSAGKSVRADLIPSEPEKVVTSSSNGSSQANPPQPPVGFDIGEYLPTDAVVRNRFYGQWFTIGLGEGLIPAVPKKGMVRLQLDVLANTRGNNRAILVPLGIAYEMGLGTGSTVPYAGVSADLMSTVIQSSTDNVRDAYRAGVAGSVFGGVNFSHDISLELRYREIQKIAGYNFSGLEATAGMRF